MSSPRYLVTARKYRPNLFHELVAQEHVTETLKNAIRLDRLAHAYLFSGPRGVGKTTAARILAKAINCTMPPEERTDAAEPCRQCTSCRDFEEGRSLNIFEIDAASNNKVDDVRELRETVRIPPQGSRKKVYIIDEVHMLSAAAFNALLKTLEEPPPHVLFIFATTEPHKVLPTILSRCQRFDFRRIPVADIIGHLRQIGQDEGVTADEAALVLLARKGDGALRDALSAFDQAVSLCGIDLRYDDLAQAFRVVDVDLFFEVTQHVAAHSSAGMLRLVDRIVRAGYDLQEFLAGLAEHLRNLLVALTMDDTALIEAAEPTRRRYAEVAKTFVQADVLRLLMVVDEAEESIKSSSQPRMKLEMALLKMAALAHAVDLRQALQQVERLEEMAREGALPAGLVAPPTQPAAIPSSPKPAAAATPEPAPPPEAQPPAATPKPPPVVEPIGESIAPPASVAETFLEETPTPQDEASDLFVDAAPLEDEADLFAATPHAEAAEPIPIEVADAEAIPAEAAETLEATEAVEATEVVEDAEATDFPAPQPLPSLFSTPALQAPPRSEPAQNKPDSKAQLQAAPQASGSPAPQAMFAGSSALKMAPEVAVAPNPALVRLTTTWPRYVKAVKTERIHVGALLQHAAPVEVEADAVVVGVPDDFHRRLLGSQHDFLLKHLNALHAEGIDRLAFTVREDLDAHPVEEAVPDVDPREYMEQKRQENPVIRAIFEQFGGELVW